MNSFFPDGITSWNNVITHFKTIPSINILKDHILSLIRPGKKHYYGIYDPIGLRHLFQLRVGLSSLKYHKKRHNFADTPSDKCSCNHGIEDSNHFLFLCPFYLTQRANLMTRFVTIVNYVHFLSFSFLYVCVSCINIFFYIGVTCCKFLECHGFGLIFMPSHVHCFFFRRKNPYTKKKRHIYKTHTYTHE